MTPAGDVLRRDIECAIARGWGLEETCRRLGCSPAAYRATSTLLDRLVAEDPPFTVTPPGAEARHIERQRRARHEREVRARVRLLAELERERATVAAAARHARETERTVARLAYRAAWMRLHRSRKAA